MSQLYDIIQEGFRALANKDITVPLRNEFYFPQAILISMSAADNNLLANKVVNTHCRNPIKFSIPSVIASGLLFDGTTGYPLIIIESTLLTALRELREPQKGVPLWFVGRNSSIYL